MTTISDLPYILQDSHNKLSNLRPPAVPFKNDTVGESESAMEGETFSELTFGMLFLAVTPWWGDMILDGGSSDQSGWQDHVAVMAVAPATVTWALVAHTDLGFWGSFGLGMVSAVIGMVAVLITQLATHKCFSMVLYNRIFRRSWMRKMQETDELNYRAKLETYPQERAEYEVKFAAIQAEASTALVAYENSSPQGKKYTLGDSGFTRVKFKDELFKDLTAGAKGLFGKLTNF